MIASASMDLDGERILILSVCEDRVLINAAELVWEASITCDANAIAQAREVVTQAEATPSVSEFDLLVRMILVVAGAGA